MTQNVGQSRGSSKHKQFVQDSANSYIVDAFQDMSLTAPGSPVDGEGYIVENAGSIDGSWGTITGLADGDIIRYRASKLEWQIVLKAITDNQGFKAYVKDEDTLYAIDEGAEWAVASGSGGGVKNFAQKQATGYKTGDWVTGNSATFGTVTTALDGTFDIEKIAPLDGKKSFRYDTDTSSGNDWIYLLVDIDLYARGSALALTFDYTWNGDEDISVEIWDPTFTNEYSTELNLLKNTENDNKKSRNSRTIYAHPDTESQVVIGIHINSAEVTGKTLIFDNLAVTDDIGTIGSTSEYYTPESVHGRTTMGNTLFTTGVSSITESSLRHLATINSSGALTYTALKDQLVTISTGAYSSTTSSTATINHWILLDGNVVARNTTGSTNGGNEAQATFSAYIKAGQVLTAAGYNYRNGASTGYFSISAQHAEFEGGTRSLQIPNGEKLKDVFSAVVNGNGTIKSDPYGFIASVNHAATGIYDVTYTAGFFTNEPSVQVSASEGGNSSCETQTTNATSARVRRFITSTTVTQDGEFHICVTKQETSPDIVGVPVAIQGQTHEQDSSTRVHTYVGYGSSGTKAMRYSITERNLGSSVTYIQSTVDGDSFTINETGLYHMQATHASSNAAGIIGIIKNSSDRTAFPYNLPVSERLVMAETESSGYRITASTTEWLVKGDVINVQADGAGPTLSTQEVFTISKVGTQPLLDGGLVERPGEEIRLRGIDAYGSASGNIIMVMNDVISNSSTSTTYVSDTVDGDYFEILEDGLYDMTLTFADNNSGGQEYGISKNSSDLTASIAALPDDQKLFTTRTPPQAGVASSVSGSALLRKGDIIRGQGHVTSVQPSDSGNMAQFTITKRGQTVKYSSRVYKEDPIAWQTKFLTTNFGTAAGDVPDLQFNNLEIGKTYRVSGLLYYGVNGSSQQVAFRSEAGGTGTIYNQNYISTASNLNVGHDMSFIFTAVSDTLYVRKQTSTNSLFGNNTTSQTHVILEELPFHSVTSRWT